MKTIIKIGRETFVLPQAKAIAVMQAMGSAIRLQQNFTPIRKPDGDRDFRDHYLADAEPVLICIEQIQDNQITIPPGAAAERPAPKSRKALPTPVRQLPFGGGL